MKVSYFPKTPANNSGLLKEQVANLDSSAMKAQNHLVILPVVAGSCLKIDKFNHMSECNSLKNEAVSIWRKNKATKRIEGAR